MNLTWHIIRKDLRRYWPFIALLALLGFTSYALNKWPSSMWLLGTLGFVRPAINGVLAVAMVVLSLGLVCFVIQEDKPAESQAFWRSRPISPGRLLAAKIALLSAVFLIVPELVSVTLQSSFVVHPLKTILARGFGQMDLYVFLPALMVVAALASATKNLGQSILTGIVLYFCASMLMIVLIHFTGRPAQTTWSMRHSRDIADAIAVGVLGIAGLFNQYFTRRSAGTIALLFVAALVFQVIHVLWSWDFIG